MLRILLVAFAYALLAWLGRLLLVQPESLASFWLPSGVGLAALALSPREKWPGLVGGLFGANLLVNMSTGNGPLVSAAFGVANCTESVVAALVANRVIGHPLRFTRLRDIVWLVLLVAVVSNGVTALVGAAVPAVAFHARYWAVWRVWWIADALGIILATPAIATWATLDRERAVALIRRRGLEGALLLVLMLGTAQFVFGSRVDAGSYLLPFPYVAFPFLLWAAVRLGVRGASLASIALAVVAVWNTAHRLGPFTDSAGQLFASPLLSIQLFLAVVTVSTLMIAALIGERTQAEAALQAANEALEAKIQERTKELTDINQKLRSEVEDREEAEHEVRRTVSELARSNNELQQFAYVASHDLREPLRAIGGVVQLLEQNYKDKLDERAREYVVHIVDGVSRMQLLIDDLLAFSRVGSRSGPQRSVETASILATVLENLSVAAKENGAVVTHDGLPVLQCDPTQLTQLLQNLVGNAIKFRGSEPPKIHVQARPDGDDWVFSVRDNGIGIDPQYFDRIFTIFQRLHTRRAYPGSGIGLAICKKIVSLHGGRIWVESQPGLGATFFFTYPRTVTARSR